jgi:hypothetical protein
VITPEVKPKLSPILNDDFIRVCWYANTCHKSNTGARPSLDGSLEGYGAQIYVKRCSKPVRP